jgi:hypothetical protein
MAAPSFSSLYKISVRRADGGIIFRPKSHNIVSEKVKAQNNRFADALRGKNIAGDCRGRKFKAFRGCLRSRGSAAYRGG